MGTPQISAISARCPRCQKAWPSSLSECPEDGASLLHELHDQLTQVFAESVVTEKRDPDPFAEADHTTIDVKASNGARTAGGDVTAISPPFDGSRTSLAAVGPISSSEITAQTERAIESTPSPTAEPVSDPTVATRLAPHIHLVPGTVIGDYEVEQLLGRGGMGAVYRGRHERLDKPVAIKVIAANLSGDADAVERFEQEAQVLARLSHPNIVDVLSVGALPDGRSYIVMELLTGEDLQERIDRGPLPFDDALDILDQIARGLEAAHAAAIIHRDLKPGNVFLRRIGTEPTPVVTLLDFGLSKSTHRRTVHTSTGVMFGTAAYMSPEQCRSARDVGPETDVYALGCIAFELLCGRAPFVYDNVAELVAAHQAEEPTHPLQLAPLLDPSLGALLSAMVAKDPGWRPSLAQVRSALGSARSKPITPTPSSPATIGTTPSSARRVQLALVGAVALGIIVAAAFAFTRRANDNGSPESIVAPQPAADNHAAPTEPSGLAIDAGVPIAEQTRVDASGATARDSLPNDDRDTTRVPRTATSTKRGPAIPSGTGTDAVTREPAVALDAGIGTTVEPVTPVDGATKGEPEKAPAHRSVSPPLANPPDRDVIVNPFKRKRGTK